MPSFYIFGIVFTIIVASCKDHSDKENLSSDQEKPSAAPHLFTLLSPADTHIDFSNNLTEGANTNVLMYEYFYNGGGVAVGDVNNDGLQDIYFSGNLGDNKLYLNKGGMKFQDITDCCQCTGTARPMENRRNHSRCEWRWQTGYLCLLFR